MRSIATILLAFLLSLSAEAELRFTEPRAFPDLGLMMPALSDATPDAVSMPHAEGFLLTDSDGSQSLEDRFDTYDLWIAQTVRCCWYDDYGNMLVVARLLTVPPDDPAGTLSTRVDFEKRLASLAIDPCDESARNLAVMACTPADVSEIPVRPRRGHRRELEKLLYYQSTNQLASVWVFRPKAPERGVKTDWYMAALVIDPSENQDAAAAQFDAYFLDRVRSLPAEQLNGGKSKENKRTSRRRRVEIPDEATLLKRDYRRSVVNYDAWHAAESGDVVVVDDLAKQLHESFVGSLTNDLPRMRTAYAAAVPSPLTSVTNVVAAVRVFSEREDYISYVGEGAEWSAAVWSPARRELVLNLPVTGTDDLLKTVRHEAFHQYLAYAGAMAESSPWFNEGHAELFEHTSFDREGKVVFEKDPVASSWIHANVDAVGEALPGFFYLDYAAFYSGTDAQRRANYWIAWSIAYFLQVGAPEVRFRPFESFRADYLSELVRSRRADSATAAVLSSDKLKLFIAEWRKFWKK